MAVEYLEISRVKEVYVDKLFPRNPYALGYGRKIPTRYRMDIRHDNGRVYRHRVYVMLYGNFGSAYVVIEGNDYFLNADAEAMLEKGPAK